MYVLADLEWVEDRSNRISLTQIAMVRVPTVDNLIVLAALLNVRIDDILVTTVA